MRNLKTLGLVLIGSLGCGTDAPPAGPEVLDGLTVPARPADGKGWQVITPIFEDIQPSMDYEVCTWSDVIADAVTDVKSTLAYQIEPPGHHAILFYTLEKQPPGTQRVCNDTDMATFRFLAGNGGNGEMNIAPANLVYRVPAGAQLVINHHYLNATDQVLRGQSVVNVNFAEPSVDNVPSGNTAIVNTSLMVDTGISAQDMHCAFDRPLKLWYFAPHEHRWGKHINVDLTISGNKQRMFDLDWDPAFTFHPPENRRDPGTPLQVNVGDSVDVHCEWNNDTGRQLAFGFEMCVAFGQFVDDQGQGNWACDNGNWTAF